MVCSAFGMLLLKAAQVWASAIYLYAGYVFEAVSFGVYPLAFRRYSMRVVSTAWCASSVLTGVAAGYAVYVLPSTYPFGMIS